MSLQFQVQGHEVDKKKQKKRCIERLEGTSERSKKKKRILKLLKGNSKSDLCLVYQPLKHD